MSVDQYLPEPIEAPETRDEAFADICRQLAEQPVIGLDTEFERSRTYYARFALLQLSGGGKTWLIDAPCISDWQPLADLLANPAVTKVMHGCEEDLEVMAQATGVYPASLFDTQVGAAFAGLEFGIGYMRLVSELLGVDLPKESQRSDWLKRPLSDQQVRYAALDSACLPSVYSELVERIEARGMADWCRAECDALVRRKQARDASDYDFRRVKGSGALTPQELSILRKLVNWRERQAKGGDLPRSWIASDALLVELCQRKPGTPHSLAEVTDIRPKLVRKHGEVLLRLISEGGQQPESEWPAASPPIPTPEQRQWLKKLKAVVRGRAEAVDLPPALLAGQRTLSALLNAGYPDGPWELPDTLTGWRYLVIGESLLDALNEFTGSRRNA